MKKYYENKYVSLDVNELNMIDKLYIFIFKNGKYFVNILYNWLADIP